MASCWVASTLVTRLVGVLVGPSEISEGWVLAGFIASWEGPGEVLGGPVEVLRAHGHVRAPSLRILR